jgi:hypothetical protein
MNALCVAASLNVVLISAAICIVLLTEAYASQPERNSMASWLSTLQAITPGLERSSRGPEVGPMSYANLTG